MNESNNWVEQLEDDLHKEDEYVASLDADIKKWKKEVKVLQLKVEELEHEKTELRKAGQHQLDAEVSIGVQHLENISNLDAKVRGFTSTIYQTGHWLGASKIQYEKIKAFFLF